MCPQPPGIAVSRRRASLAPLRSPDVEAVERAVERLGGEQAPIDPISKTFRVSHETGAMKVKLGTPWVPDA